MSIDRRYATEFVAGDFFSRRNMLRQSALGFGAVALAGLLADDNRLCADTQGRGKVTPTPQAKAKSIVFIFLGGGPGHVDTFDPKPELARLDGQNVPDSIAKDVPKIARAPLV